MDGASRDRFGLTWHPLLAGAILTNGHRLDIVEVIPEGRFLDSRRARRALRTLAREIPVAIHGVSLGFAAAGGVDVARLDAFARLMDDVVPEHWSDHLAFVRAGGVELGHLAAPTRTALTVEAAAENLERAARRVGAPPLAENVSTLLDPPGSDRTEQTWLLELLEASGSDLLLDLHNLVTNGQNLGYDPRALVDALPAHRIRAIHIAGGSEVEAASGERRLLDDHRHAVPDSVYALLERVGERVPHALDVILERDGAFPTFDALLGELDRARVALAAGRARRAESLAAPPRGLRATARIGSTRESVDVRRATSFEAARQQQARVEALLAALYVDRAARERWLADPEGEGRRAGLDDAARAAVRALDRDGLELAAASFAHKRRAGRH
ncbi:MAG: DUF692 family multinuclear iron-containing protein [Vicinamibacteraceae bacterium]